MKKAMRCLFPKCKITERGGRGLCSSHYATAHMLVKKGLVTWEQLEKKGKADPPKRKWGNTSETTKYFLS